jgi:hypothetical protein
MFGMDAKAREVLAVIQQCLATDRFSVLPHFLDRLALRGLAWADVLAVIDDPTGVRSSGLDVHRRPKWVVAGIAADGLKIEIVCVLDVDEHGDQTVFITIY